MPDSPKAYRRKETNITKQNRTRNYCTDPLTSRGCRSLEMAEIRASPGVVEFLRSPLDPQVRHAHIDRSSCSVTSILDNNPECDPLPSFAFARDHP